MKSERRQLLAVVLGSALFRLALLTLPRLIRWDEPIYLWLGRSFWTGLGFTSPAGHPELHHAPLYPLLSGALFALTGRAELASDVWYVLLGPLLALPVYFLARRLSVEGPGQGGALFAAGLVGVFPGLTSAVLYWGTMSEPLFLLLIYTAVAAAAWALDRDRAAAYALPGLALGLAYLARPEGFVWIASLAAFWLLAWALRGTLRRSRNLLHLGVFVGAFALAAAPYVLFLHRHSGKWMLTGKVSITWEIGEAVEKGDDVLYDRVTSTLDPATGDTRWASSGQGGRGLLTRLREEPAVVLGRLGRNGLHIARSSLTSPIFSLALLLPVLWAVSALPWTRQRIEGYALLAAAALPVAAFLTFHVQQRFFAPAFPALLIAAATAGWELARRKGLLFRILLAFLLLGYLGWGHRQVIERGLAGSEFAHEASGRWLGRNTASNARILSRDLAISVYAGRGYVTSPRAPWPELLAYARQHGATHLVVDDHEIRTLRPYLGFLVDAPPPEVQLLASSRDRHGTTWIFALRPGA